MLSEIKKSAYLKDSLQISLGKINNFDQSFLNGELRGMNGKTVNDGMPLLKWMKEWDLSVFRFD